MRIGILEVGDRPAELEQNYPSYGDMVADWLSPISLNKSTTITHYPIMYGAPLPEPTEADLWAITGSKFGVYEDHPWIPKLMEFIVQAQQAKVKMIGICFGHQIIAQALGGQVIKSDKGWGVGLAHYDVQAQPTPLSEPPVTFSKPPATLDINAYHQDQITQLPPDAVVLASSDFCPAGALWYPGFGVSFQGHPEFSNEYEHDLVDLRKRLSFLDANVADLALASLKQNNNRLDWANWVAENWERF